MYSRWFWCMLICVCMLTRYGKCQNLCEEKDALGLKAEVIEFALYAPNPELDRNVLLDSVRKIVLFGNQDSRTHLIEKCVNIQELIIEGDASLSDKNFPNMSQWAGLRNLKLTNTNVTGDFLGTLSNTNNLNTVNISSNKIDRAFIAQINKLVNIQLLDVSNNTNIDDQVVVELSKMRYLKELNMEGTGITPKALSGINKIATLQKVILPASINVNQALQELSLLPYLEEVVAHGVLTDNGIISAANCKSLKTIYIDGTSVSNKGFNSLKAMVSLKVLFLKNVEVDAELVQAIQECDSLEQLDLRDCSFKKGTSVYGLSNIKSLKNLSLSSNEITDEHVLGLAYNDQITDLRLESDGLSNSALKGLVLFPRLRALKLKSNKIDSLHAIPSAALNGIKDLDLSKTRIGSKDLSVLSKYQTLVSLNLDGTNISQETDYKELEKLRRLNQLTAPGFPDGNVKNKVLFNGLKDLILDKY